MKGGVARSDGVVECFIKAQSELKFRAIRRDNHPVLRTPLLLKGGELSKFEFSTNFLERLMWRAAAEDIEVLRKVEELASRRAAPSSILTPRNLVRAVRAARRVSTTGGFASIGSPEKGGGPNLIHMLQGTLEVQGR